MADELDFDGDFLGEMTSQNSKRMFKIRNTKRQIRPNLVCKNLDKTHENDHALFQYMDAQTGMVRRVEDQPPHRALEAVGPLALQSFNVAYSLDKRNRWETVQKFRDDIEGLQDPSIGLTVSGLELYMLPFTPFTNTFAGHLIRDPFQQSPHSNDTEAAAYHSVDKGGKPVHRFAKQLTAKIFTLTDKAEPPPQGHRRRIIRHQREQVEAQLREANEEQAEILTNIDKKKETRDWERPAHIRYLFLTEHPSRKLEDKKHYDSKDTRKRFIRLAQKEKRAANKDMMRETDDYYYESEEEGGIEETSRQTFCGNLPDSLSTAHLEDFVVTTKRKLSKKKKATRLPLDAAFERWLLRQFSVEVASSSGLSNPEPQDHLPNRVHEPILPMLQIEILLPEQDVEPQALKATYKDAYFECATLPRRFVLNVSETVRSVMNVSQGADVVQTKNIQAFVVFEMQITTRDDLLRSEASGSDEVDEDCGPMTRVKIWLNILLNNDADLIISPEKCYDDEMDLNSFLKSVVVYIGTLPIEAFPTNAQDILQQRNPASSIVMDFLPQLLLPKTSCLKDVQISNTALLESHMVRQIQRQITVVANYHNNTCNWFVDPYKECAVCFANEFDLDGMKLSSCGHFFCSQCWRDHAVQALDAGLVPIKCMDSHCKSTVDYDTAISLLPLALCERYANQLSERHLLVNSKTWRYCRNDRCQRVIRITGPAHIGVVACDCGETFCGQCGDAVHFPASCKHAEMYIRTLTSLGDDKAAKYNIESTEKQVKVKRCPQCSTPMQKNKGCTHMSCRCGHQFCWECLQPWGGKHYSCANSKDGFEMISLRDVRFRSKAGEMPFFVYEQCAALRRSTFAPNLQPIREQCVKLGISKKTASEYIHFHVEITRLLEFTIAFAYFKSLARTKKERRARRPQLQGVLSVVDRVAFLLKRWQQMLEAGQKDSIEPILQQAKIVSGDLARMAARYSIAL